MPLQTNQEQNRLRWFSPIPILLRKDGKLKKAFSSSWPTAWKQEPNWLSCISHGWNIIRSQCKKCELKDTTMAQTWPEYIKVFKQKFYEQPILELSSVLAQLIHWTFVARTQWDLLLLHKNISKTFKDCLIQLQSLQMGREEEGKMGRRISVLHLNPNQKLDSVSDWTLSNRFQATAKCGGKPRGTSQKLRNISQSWGKINCQEYFSLFFFIWIDCTWDCLV